MSKLDDWKNKRDPPEVKEHSGSWEKKRRLSGDVVTALAIRTERLSAVSVACNCNSLLHHCSFKDPILKLIYIYMARCVERDRCAFACHSPSAVSWIFIYFTPHRWILWDNIKVRCICNRFSHSIIKTDEHPFRKAVLLNRGGTNVEIRSLLFNPCAYAASYTFIMNTRQLCVNCGFIGEFCRSRDMPISVTWSLQLMSYHITYNVQISVVDYRGRESPRGFYRYVALTISCRSDAWSNNERYYRETRVSLSLSLFLHAYMFIAIYY